MTVKSTRAQTPRSRNGCLTCRSRHIKCDETLPVCKNCIKSNKVCERGARLNFLKSMVAKPSTTKVFESISFLDQSYSIHKIYRENGFHDYSGWFKNHTESELLASDIDLQDGQTTSTIRPAAAVSSARVLPTARPTLNAFTFPPHNLSMLEENSDSESSVQSSTFPSLKSSINTFVNKLLTLSSYPIEADDHLLFIFSLREPTTSKIDAVMQTTSASYNSCHLTLSECGKFIDYLEDNGLDSYEDEQTGTRLSFASLLSSFVLAIKLGKLDGIFEESYLSSKIISYITETIKLEQHQTYDNLMIFFELLLLDLDHSLSFNQPAKINMIDDHIEHILKKIISWSLFDDLNYFLVGIMIILMKLNNLYHGTLNSQPDAYQLSGLLNELKALEDNQFIYAYLPHVSNGAFALTTGASISSASSSSQSTFTSFNSSLTALPKVEFQNAKVRRFHIYYNFTLTFIFRQFKLNDQQTALFFTNTTLLNYWNSFEKDMFQRLTFLTFNYNYEIDPFMRFITKMH